MSGRLYLDACSIIYLHEGAAALQNAVSSRILSHRSDPAALLVTSRLARLECRIGPLKVGNQVLLDRYEAFFSARRMMLSEIDAAVIEEATSLRARYRVKTPDAIHLATAILEGASAFLTNDGDLLRCTEINVELISPKSA